MWWLGPGRTSTIAFGAVVTMIAIAAPALASGNLFTNGGFATDASGWVASNIGYVATEGGSPPFPGNPSGFFILNAAGGTTTDPYIEQTVGGLVVGERYLISGERAWAHDCCGTISALSFGVAVDGAVLLELDRKGLPQGTWSPFAVEFTATSTTHTIRFTAERNGDDSSYGVDNLSLTGAATAPIPELPSVMFLAVGLAALVGLVGLRARRS